MGGFLFHNTMGEVLMNNIFLQSPVSEQDFIWVAAYSDGTFFSEYSYDTKVENSFYDIDRSKLIRFGLVGYGMNMFFEVYGGTFNIAGRMYEIIYKDKKENKDYHLTGHGFIPYNDIIQFKNAHSNFNPREGIGSLKSTIDQFNFGYKQTLNLDNVQFHYKAVCSIPYGNPIYLNIRLVAARDFEDGVIIIKRNGTNVFEIDAPMKANVAYETNWSVIL
jgi:hypothetical protein